MNKLFLVGEWENLYFDSKDFLRNLSETEKEYLLSYNLDHYFASDWTVYFVLVKSSTYMKSYVFMDYALRAIEFREGESGPAEALCENFIEELEDMLEGSNLSETQYEDIAIRLYNAMHVTYSSPQEGIGIYLKLLAALSRIKLPIAESLEKRLEVEKLPWLRALEEDE